jgi:hypothetical protein
MRVAVGFALWCSTAVFALGPVFAAAAADAPRQDGSVLGAKIYEHRGGFDAFFARWQGIGLNAVLATEPLLRTPGFVESARTHGLAGDFIRHFVFWETVAPEGRPSCPPSKCERRTGVSG